MRTLGFVLEMLCMHEWMNACPLQMCTFAPKLNKRPLSEEWAGSVIERSHAWQARRDQKVHEAREQDADKDLQGCTFWSVPPPPCVFALSLTSVCALVPGQSVCRTVADVAMWVYL